MTASHTFSAAHVLQLADVVGRFGVSADELFEGIDIDPSRLGEPLHRVSIGVLEQLAVRAMNLTGESSALGVFLGMQMRVSAHGYLRSEKLSLEDVAARVGYSDVANFTRAFRRWTGLTPGAFRRAAKR